MGKPYQVKDEAGNPGNWFFFSEKAGDVIDAGPDKETADALAAAENGDSTIADALEGKEDAINEVSDVPNEPKAAKSESGLEKSRRASDGTTPSDSPRKTPALSPQFLRKIKEKAASGSASVSIELERFLIARFGFSTEDMEEDDPDVELLVLGWELQWEYWLAGKEPPAWALIVFGQVCVTARLLASAKAKVKAPTEDSLPLPEVIPIVPKPAA